MNWLLYRGERFNANFYYQSGVDIDSSFFLAKKGRRVLLVPQMHKEYAESLFNGEVISFRKKPLQSLSKLVKKSETLGLDYPSLSASIFTKLSKNFKKIKTFQKN